MKIYLWASLFVLISAMSIYEEEVMKSSNDDMLTESYEFNTSRTGICTLGRIMKKGRYDRRRGI